MPKLKFTIGNTYLRPINIIILIGILGFIPNFTPAQIHISSGTTLSISSKSKISIITEDTIYLLANNTEKIHIYDQHELAKSLVKSIKTKKQIEVKPSPQKVSPQPTQEYIAYKAPENTDTKVAIAGKPHPKDRSNFNTHHSSTVIVSNPTISLGNLLISTFDYQLILFTYLHKPNFNFNFYAENQFLIASKSQRAPPFRVI